MVCQVAKSSSPAKGVIIKYLIYLFPRSRGEILEMGEAPRQGAWPGLKIAEGEFPLGPKPTTAWQCPILPLIVPGTSFATLAVAPTADRLRQGIANVMT